MTKLFASLSPVPATVLMNWVADGISRTRLLSVSQTNRSPPVLAHSPSGELRVAAESGAFSAKGPVPAPTRRLMMLSAPRTRIVLPWNSVTNSLVVLSTNTPNGLYRVAEVPKPPSPVEDAPPVPTTVEIIVVLAVTFLTLLFRQSAKYKFPELSRATKRGARRVAMLAQEPSPFGSEVRLLGVPVPA